MVTTARGFDGPGGFTSAESDDVKADGCKSYGGGGWKIKRGGQSGTVVIQREAVRAWREQGDRDRERERERGGEGERGQMNGKGTQGRIRTYTRMRGKGRNGQREHTRGIDNSRIYSLTSYTFGCQTFVMKRMLGGLYG